MKKNNLKRENGFEDAGGYMDAKKSKLEDQFCLQAAKLKGKTHAIFEGVAIFVNGYTEPSSDVLKHLMMLYGGTYHHYYRRGSTTHIIATNLPHSKMEKHKDLRVVKPEWITKSIASGKLLAFRDYLLFAQRDKSQPSLQSFELKKSSTIFNAVKNGIHTENHDTSDIQVASNINTDSETFITDLDKNSALLVYENELSDSVKKCDGNSIFVDQVKSDTAINSVPHRSTKNANDTNFLSEFYSNSRLHHISTMGAVFKQYVGELRAKNTGEFRGRDKLIAWKEIQPSSIGGFKSDEEYSAKPFADPVIMHIDMDCFFVSVGLRNRQQLRGVPVAVTHAKGNAPVKPRDGVDRKAELNIYKKRLQEKYNSRYTAGGTERATNISNSSRLNDVGEFDSMAEIASCSYEARAAGVKNGMFLGQALKLCPNLKTIPYDFEGYKEVSYCLYDTIASYTLDIEAVSCDELFVDCTKLLAVTSATPQELATFLRKEIKEKTSCSCSAGFGPNRLLARLATKKAKPDGQFVLEAEKVAEFMKNIKVVDIPGVGRTTSCKLLALGVQHCAELQEISLSRLQAEFGMKLGETLYKHCRGEDNRNLALHQVRKSVSAEVNYGIRFQEQAQADAFIKQVASEVATRLKEVKMKGRCVTLKLMVRAKDAPQESAKFLGHGVCSHITKSSMLRVAVSDADIISREVMSIIRQLSVNSRDLRGIGIQMSRLEDETKHVASSMVMDRFFAVKKNTNQTTSNTNELCLTKEIGELVSKDSIESPAVLNQCPQNPLDAETSNNKTGIIKNENTASQHSFSTRQQSSNRPSKMLNKMQPTTAALHDFFQNIEKIGSGKVMKKKQIILMEGVDRDVFAALPEDIQQEVLLDCRNSFATSAKNKNCEEMKSLTKLTDSDYKYTKKSNCGIGPNNRHGTNHQHQFINADISFSQIDQSFLDALPPSMTKEIEADYMQRKLNKMYLCAEEENIELECKLSLPSKENNSLNNFLTLREMRTLVEEWVMQEKCPQPCDLLMLSNYVNELVTSRKIEELHILLRCFHCFVDKKRSCHWQSVYNNVIAEVQETMLTTYQAKLMVQTSFR